MSSTVFSCQHQLLPHVDHGFRNSSVSDRTVPRTPLHCELFQAGENTTHPLEVTEIDEEDQKSEEKAALKEIKERNDDLRLLERAVSQVNALHEHLNFIVHHQNSVMDRIDRNISQATEYTTKVMKDTDEAVQLSQEARQKSMLVFFLIGVLLFVVFMMLFTFFKVWVFGVR
ncbi:hypothetical protein Y032_0113g350 [Ancylostoma ceylanicum]|uniref:t-SNARE coiled-coil homology domain-containing protein n=1 Tax=Ancylostoma ceylanicum TaxID=53326 RepID=A0A016TDA7_9BILA|nr:hypothetical protein Y032_0113g350 [Ancylostoma ceylanicum]